MIEFFYNDSEDLPKLLALDALLHLYTINPNSVLSKFKTLICIGNWRISIKLCEYASNLS